MNDHRQSRHMNNNNNNNNNNQKNNSTTTLKKETVTILSEDDLNQIVLKLQSIVSQGDIDVSNQQPLFKKLAQVRTQAERRRVFERIHAQCFQVMQLYHRRQHELLLTQLLLALNSLLQNDQNAADWSEQYGKDSVKVIFMDCLLSGKADPTTKITAMKVLTHCAKVNDACRIYIRELRGIKLVLDMVKSTNSKIQRAAANLLEAFSMNDANKTLVPELNGLATLLSLLETNTDRFVVESSVCALSVLATGNTKNRESISGKCPVRPLWNLLMETLKLSTSDATVNANSLRTAPRLEPELVVVLDKILQVILIILEKKERVHDVYNIEGMNVIELMLSMVCYLHSTERMHNTTAINSNAQSCINTIISILNHMCILEPARKLLLSQLRSDQPVTEEHFYIYVKGKVMNGARLILDQFMSSNMACVPFASQLLSHIAKYEPESVLSAIDFNNGEYSCYIKCLSFVKSNAVDSQTRACVAELLGRITASEKNRTKMSGTIKSDIIQSICSLLEHESAQLQWAAFNLLRHLELSDVSLVQNCLQTIERTVPVHRLCDWILQMDHSTDADLRVFIILEVLKDLLIKERISGSELAYLGVVPILISLIDNKLFKEISLFILGIASSRVEVRDHILNLGGLDKIVPLLLDEDEESSFTSALKIMNNMSDKYIPAQVAIAELGGLKNLLQVLETKKDVVQRSPSKPTAHTASSPTEEKPSVISPKMLKIQLLVTSIIKNLLDLEPNVYFATLGGAVDIFLPLCLSISSSLVKQVVLALLSLSRAEENKLPLAQSEVLLSLLECENSDIQENVCNILSNVALREDCRQVLMNNNAYSKIQNLVESDDSLISLLAQMVLNHFKKVDVSSLKRRAFELSQQSTTDFEQKKKQIETDYVKRYESMIKRSSIRASASTAFDALSVEINWDFFDNNLKTEDQKRTALHLMKKNMWDNLRKSICTFCDQSAHHSQALLHAVKVIVVQFAETSSVHYVAGANSVNSMVASAGTMYYNVGYDEMNSLSVQDFVDQLNILFYQGIKKMKRNSVLDPKSSEGLLSTPSPSVLENAQKDPIQTLRAFAKEAATNPLQLGALGKLVNTPSYYINQPNDDAAIRNIVFKLLLKEEIFLKGYRLVKINKDGLKQERFLIITDKSYYTVKYDFSKQDIDRKHLKRYGLHELFVLDVGHFDKHEDKLFLNVFMKQRINKPRSSTIARRKETQSQYVADLFSSYNENAAPPRPSTDSCNFNLFIPPEIDQPNNKGTDMVQVQKNRRLLLEIAWILHAASSQLNGMDMLRPYENEILEKPTGKLSSFIYNKFKFGKL